MRRGLLATLPWLLCGMLVAGSLPSDSDLPLSLTTDAECVESGEGEFDRETTPATAGAWARSGQSDHLRPGERVIATTGAMRRAELEILAVYCRFRV